MGRGVVPYDLATPLTSYRDEACGKTADPAHAERAAWGHFRYQSIMCPLSLFEEILHTFSEKQE